MNEEVELPDATAKPEDGHIKKTSLLRTLMSLAVFVAVYYWIFRSWFAVASLVTVIVIHEAGHFIAMKFFGYRSVNMTFVPFVGAYVSGQAINLSRKNKLIVLLAGPVPGIVIGCALFLLYMHNNNQLYFQLATPFLLLNSINLLPIIPLDGGQFLKALYFKGSRILQVVFLILAFVVLVYSFYKSPAHWYLLIIAVLVVLRIWKMYFINKVRRKLDEEGIDYACSYDDLTDEEYAGIRKVLISESRRLGKKYSPDEQNGDEQDIIRQVETVLVPAFEEDLTPRHKLAFTLVWLLSMALPALLWLSYKGIL